MHLALVGLAWVAGSLHDPAPLEAEVARLVDAAGGAPAPGVAVTVVHGGEVAWFGGLGVRDRRTQEPVTEDTVFAVASVSKSVAAWGFLRLVEAGHLGLDEPILEHVEGWRPRRRREQADGITLRRLMCHTAGLTVHGVNGVAHGQPLPGLLDSILGRPPRFTRVELGQRPGEGYRYSGGGTSLAQLAFEQLEERDFAEAMRADVLLPLGMGISGFHWNEARVAASATPYLPSGEVTDRLDYPQTAPAGFVASSKELARFAIACMPDHRPPAVEEVLPRTALLTMYERSPESSFTTPGFFYKPIEGLDTFGHTGGDFGWTSVLRISPDGGDALLVLQNCFQAEALSREIESAWARWVQGRLQ